MELNTNYHANYTTKTGKDLHKTGEGKGIPNEEVQVTNLSMLSWSIP